MMEKGIKSVAFEILYRKTSGCQSCLHVKKCTHFYQFMEKETGPR